MIISKQRANDIDILCGETEYLKIGIVPAAGGKIASLFNKRLQKEFLWRNKGLALEKCRPGDDYDSHFYGGMDELIPNDIPESVDGLAYPDHGELWTTSLDYALTEDAISVSGKLATSGLFYSKTVRMDEAAPMVFLDYTIRNEAAVSRPFLWKLHAALKIEAGDKLVSPAKRGKVVDPAYSRFTLKEAFRWPVIEDQDASVVPPKGNGVDFFYLFDADDGVMNFLDGGNRSLFSIRYDQTVFPYQWYFASYGGFLDHYTAILEPCTSMPISVNDAAKMRQCTVLGPGEEITTRISIYAGENNSSTMSTRL